MKKEIMLKCECGSKEFIKETNYKKDIVNEYGEWIGYSYDDEEVLYFCRKCGEEITEEY